MSSAAEMALRTASDADIGFVMSVERLPGYPALVGTFAAGAHARAMAAPGTRYVIAEQAGRPAGFAVLRQDAERPNNVTLARFAMAERGRGLGRAALEAICREVFAMPGVARIALDVLPSNLPARRLYARCGFAEEGLMRQVLRLPDGSLADLHLMALLRADWSGP
ncbi:GNAT family N-acetyltransferase [Poseidonocella sp. HB161398]|uniref:GNAT family N-acetyltransferase n=1 Tax=Poseidonocella sp. HB161398 TaxID=2320855 RepID=UPI0019813CD1|nr:GNAT family N-acetyltransferase [Poseidonocella sp. HB161398]